nr:hypothetical protein [Tanacetum cinerariifolium]
MHQNTNNTPKPNLPITNNTTTNTTTPTGLLNTPKPCPSLPFSRLSPKALQKRRAKGLCFRCPKKFHPGHVCSPPQFLLIAGNENETDSDIIPDSRFFYIEGTSSEYNDPPLATDPHTPNFLSISDAAYLGLKSPRAVHVTGHIQGQSVTILVDYESTHNIIQPRTASLLSTTPTQIRPFPVMVGSGHFLECNSLISSTPIEINKTKFNVPIFIVPVTRADVILGLSWLSSLGTITPDFDIPQISFMVNGKPCVLRGEPLSAPINPSSLNSLIKKNSVASLHTMIYHHQPLTAATPTPTQHQNPHIQSILSKHQNLFETPHGLPPARSYDHYIPLLPDTKPINIKPYHYRALNATTIRDRFPIPTVDELLNELHGATIFSKIDLCAGYHQIRVSPDDVHKTAFHTIDGHYEFRVMPFGLTNAPSSFQAAMNDLFRKFHAKRSKCMFAKASIPFLGYITSAHGVQANPKKIVAIQAWPTPSSFTHLRAFLGLTGYYRRFVPTYAHIASPLTDILKQTTFTWNEKAANAFQSLKTAMSQLITLALPNFSKPFNITTDASEVAIGRLLIPNIPDLRLLILEEFHASTLGGHRGIQATTRRLLSSFFWPTLKQDVIDYIKKCSTCQATKYPTQKPCGLLQSFPTPSKPWTDIMMDFITHLTPSNGKTAIWVIVDRLSKFSHFIALPSQYTATTLAAIFLKDIYRLHGIPSSITSEATWEDWL